MVVQSDICAGKLISLSSPAHIPHSVPQIFINLTPVTHVKPDVSS